MTITSLNILKNKSIDIDYRIYGTKANFLFYDRILTQVTYYPSAGVLTDINNDGRNEYVFSIVDYPFNPIPLLIIGDEDGKLNLTLKYFPNGAPKVGQSSFIYYKDINSDGFKDIVASDAGFDYPPWTGHKIGVALGNGNYLTDVSNLIPDTEIRSYAVGVADINGDGKVDILMPAQGSNNISDSKILTFYLNEFKLNNNPIPNYVSSGLNGHTAIQVADFNKDGFQDLLFSGSWADQNNRIVYGSKNGVDSLNINSLPAGPSGQDMYDYLHSNSIIPPKIAVSGPEVYSIILDFNSDGLPDVFSLATNQTQYPPGVYTGNAQTNNDVYKNGGMVSGDLNYFSLINIDGYRFSPKINSNNNLGDIYYRNAFPYDINLDGKMDIIGHYWSNNSPKYYGTTFFINDGYGNLTPIDASEIFPQLKPSQSYERIDNPLTYGWIVPIENNSSNLLALQILPSSDQSGLMTIQEFSCNEISKLVPNIPILTNNYVSDRNGKQYFDLGAGNDTINYLNSNYVKNIKPNLLTIHLEATHINFSDNPLITIEINGSMKLKSLPITGVRDVTIQAVNIDVSELKIINSLKITIENTKYIDDTHLSYVTIHGITFLDQKVSLTEINYVNGFAFNSDGAHMDSGSMSLNTSEITNLNSRIINFSNLNSDIVDGGAGKDTSLYSGPSTDFLITHNKSGTWSVFKTGSVNDLLTNIERLQFKDKSVAIDITGNAGTTAKILGAVFGKESLSNKNYVGIGLHFLDAGWTYDNLAGLALDAAGAKTNDQIVSLLWTNVIGTKPTALDKQPFIALLENGMSAGALAHMAADTAFNTTNINLVGLAQTGIEYIPVS